MFMEQFWQEWDVHLQVVFVKKYHVLECVKSIEDSKCGLMVKINHLM
jgi:hypothetical protein